MIRPRVLPFASTRPPKAWSVSIRPMPATSHQGRWQDGIAVARLASALRYAASTVTGMPVAPSVTPGAPESAVCACASTAATSTGAASGVAGTTGTAGVGLAAADGVTVTNDRVGARSSSSVNARSAGTPGGSSTAAAAAGGAAAEPGRA